MKNFLDLQATELSLTVQCNGQVRQHNLRDPLCFAVSDHVIIDGIDVLPGYMHCADNGTLKINEPFYCWLHRASNQGWLLEPFNKD